MSGSDDRIELGRITGAWGTAGWVRVYSLTSPSESIFDYQPWRSERSPGHFHVRQWRRQGPRLVAQIDEIVDRDQAEAAVGATLHTTRDALPPAGPGQWYWHDLVGMQVVDREGRELGKVAGLIDVGAHDVLRVAAADGGEELLIPFVPDTYVLAVDGEARRIRVDWQLEWSRDPE